MHNNAYAFERRPAQKLAEESWNHQRDVCLKSIFYCVQASTSRRCTGAIVNTSSIHAIMGFSEQAAYDVAKGAVCAMTRALPVEYAPRVRVNAVLPGGIPTAAWVGTTRADMAAFVAATPAQRLGTPDEIAAAVCFLASDDASYITGASLVMNRGYTVTRP